MSPVCPTILPIAEWRTVEWVFFPRILAIQEMQLDISSVWTESPRPFPIFYHSNHHTTSVDSNDVIECIYMEKLRKTSPINGLGCRIGWFHLSSRRPRPSRIVLDKRLNQFSHGTLWYVKYTYIAITPRSTPTPNKGNRQFIHVSKRTIQLFTILQTCVQLND